MDHDFVAPGDDSKEPFHIGDMVLTPSGRKGVVFAILHSDLGLPYDVGYCDPEGGTDCFEAESLRLMARVQYEMV